MATQYPADYIGQGLASHNNVIRGSLVVGAQADFVVLNEQVEVQSTWISGKEVFSKQ